MDGFRFMVCKDGAMQGDDFPASIDTAYAEAQRVYNVEVEAGDTAPLVTIVLIGPAEWAREFQTAQE